MEKGMDDHQLTKNTNTILEVSNEMSDYDLARSLRSQVIFLVGQSKSNLTQQRVLEEDTIYGDVLQEAFLDTYNNLTIKSLMLLKWINRFNEGQPRVKYVMKCDDDTFLNVPNLMHELMGGSVPVYKDTIQLHTKDTISRRTWVDSASLTGYLFRNAHPIREVASKWYAPKFMYRKKVFPNYLSGTGYLIEATETAKRLYTVALHTPLFHLEDVYVTGICALESVSTRPHHNPLFSFLRYANRPCALRGMITQHPMTAQDIEAAYNRLTNESFVCEQPPEESMSIMLKAQSTGHNLRREAVNYLGLIMAAVVLTNLVISIVEQ